MRQPQAPNFHEHIKRHFVESHFDEYYGQIISIRDALGKYNSDPHVANTGAQLNYAITKKGFYDKIGMTEEEYRKRPVEGIARGSVYQTLHYGAELASRFFNDILAADPNITYNEAAEMAITEAKKYTDEIVSGLQKKETSGQYLAGLASADKEGNLRVEKFGAQMQTPLTAGVDIGSPIGSFLVQATSSSLSFKLLNGFWNQTTVAALLEDTRDQARYGLEGILSPGAQRAAGIVGTAMTFGEMMLAAKIGGIAGASVAKSSVLAKAAVAARSKAALGSGAYFLINSAFNDTLYRKGTALRYWSDTDVHDKDLGAYLGSRIHDGLTYWATMAITGPFVTHQLTKTLKNPDSFGKAIWWALHPAVNAVTDSLTDTTLDFGTFLFADKLIGAEYFTQESQRLYGLDTEQLLSAENLKKFGNMWFRRASLRIANAMVAKPLMSQVERKITGKPVTKPMNMESKDWWKQHYTKYWTGKGKGKHIDFVSTVSALTYKYLPSNLPTMQRLWDDPNLGMRPPQLKEMNFADAFAQGKIDDLLLSAVFFESERIVNAVYDLSVSNNLANFNPRALDFMTTNRAMSETVLAIDMQAGITSRNKASIGEVIRTQVDKIINNEYVNYVEGKDYTEPQKELIRTNLTSSDKDTMRYVEELLAKSTEKDNINDAMRAVADIIDNSSKRIAGFLNATFEFRDPDSRQLPILNKGPVGQFRTLIEKYTASKQTIAKGDEVYKRDALLEIHRLSGGRALSGEAADDFPITVLGISGRNQLDEITGVNKQIENFVKLYESIPENERHLYSSLTYFLRTNEGEPGHTDYVKQILEYYQKYKSDPKNSTEAMIDLVLMKNSMVDHNAADILELHKDIEQTVRSDTISDVAKGQRIHELVNSINDKLMLFGSRLNVYQRNSLQVSERYLRTEKIKGKTIHGHAMKLMHDYRKASKVEGTDLIDTREIDRYAIKRSMLNNLLLHSESISHRETFERIVGQMYDEETRKLLLNNDTYYNALLNVVGNTTSVPENLSIKVIMDGEQRIFTTAELMAATILGEVETATSHKFALVGLKAFSREYVRKYGEAVRIDAGTNKFTLDNNKIKDAMVELDQKNMQTELENTFGIPQDSEDVMNIRVSSEKEGYSVTVDVRNANELANDSFIRYYTKKDDIGSIFKSEALDAYYATDKHQDTFLVRTENGQQSYTYREVLNALKGNNPAFLKQVQDTLSLATFSFSKSITEILNDGTKTPQEKDRLKANLYHELEEIVREMIVQSSSLSFVTDAEIDVLARKIISKEIQDNSSTEFNIIDGITAHYGITDKFLMVDVSKELQNDIPIEIVERTLTKMLPGYSVKYVGVTTAGYKNNYLAVPFNSENFSDKRQVDTMKTSLRDWISKSLMFDDTAFEEYLKDEPLTDDSPYKQYWDRQQEVKKALLSEIDNYNVTDKDSYANLLHKVLTKLDLNTKSTIEEAINSINVLQDISRDKVELTLSSDIVEMLGKRFGEILNLTLDKEGKVGEAWITALEKAMKAFKLGDEVITQVKGGQYVQVIQGAYEEGLSQVDMYRRLYETAKETIRKGTHQIVDTYKVLKTLGRVLSQAEREVKNIDIELQHNAKILLEDFEFEHIHQMYEVLYRGFQDQLQLTGIHPNYESVVTMHNLEQVLQKNIEKRYLSEALYNASSDKPANVDFLERMMLMFGATQGRSIYSGEPKRIPLELLHNEKGSVGYYRAFKELFNELPNQTFSIAIHDIKTQRRSDPYDGNMMLTKELYDMIVSILGDKYTGGLGIHKVVAIAQGQVQGINAEYAGINRNTDINMNVSILKEIAPEFKYLLERHLKTLQPSIETPEGKLGYEVETYSPILVLTKNQAAYLFSKYVRHVEQLASVEERHVVNRYTSKSAEMSEYHAIELRDKTDPQHLVGYNAGEANARAKEGQRLYDTLNIVPKQITSYNMLAPLMNEPNYRVSNVSSFSTVTAQNQTQTFRTTQEIDMPLSSLLRMLQKNKARPAGVNPSAWNTFLKTISQNDTLKEKIKSITGQDKSIQYIHQAMSNPKSVTKEEFDAISSSVVEVMTKYDMLMRFNIGTDEAPVNIYMAQLIREGAETKSHLLPVVLRGISHDAFGDKVGVSEMFRLISHGDFDGDQAMFSSMNKNRFRDAFYRVVTQFTGTRDEDKKNDKHFLTDILKVEEREILKTFENTHPSIAVPTAKATLEKIYDPKIRQIGGITTNSMNNADLLFRGRIQQTLVGKHMGGISRDITSSLSNFLEGTPFEKKAKIFENISVGITGVEHDQDAIFFKRDHSKILQGASVIGAQRLYHDITMQPLEYEGREVKMFLVRDDSRTEAPYVNIVVAAQRPEISMGYQVLYKTDQSFAAHDLTKANKAELRKNIEGQIEKIVNKSESAIGISDNAEFKHGLYKVNDDNLYIGSYEGLQSQLYRMVVHIGDASAPNLVDALAGESKDIGIHVFNFFNKARIAQALKWQFEEIDNTYYSAPTDILTQVERVAMTSLGTDEYARIQNKVKTSLSGAGIIDKLNSQFHDDKTSMYGYEGSQALIRLMQGKKMTHDQLKIIHDNKTEINNLAKHGVDYEVVKRFLSIDQKDTKLYNHLSKYVDWSSESIKEHFSHLEFHKGIVSTLESDRDYRTAYYLETFSNMMARLPMYLYSPLVADGKDKVIVPDAMFGSTTSSYTTQRKFAEHIYKQIYSSSKSRLAGVSLKDVNRILSEIGIGLDSNDEKHTKHIDTTYSAFLPWVSLRKGTTVDVQGQQQRGTKLVATATQQDLTMKHLYFLMNKHIDELNKAAGKNKLERLSLEKSKLVVTAMMNLLDINSQGYTLLASAGLTDTKMLNMVADAQEKYITISQEEGRYDGVFKITSSELLDRIFTDFKYNMIFTDRVTWDFGEANTTRGLLTDCF